MTLNCIDSLNSIGHTSCYKTSLQNVYHYVPEEYSFSTQNEMLFQAMNLNVLV